VLIQERGLHYKWQLVLRCDSCHYDAVADELQMIVDPDELTPAAELHEAYERGWQDGYTFAEKARDKQELDTEINPDPPEAAA
jgi:hypothetical protein